MCTFVLVRYHPDKGRPVVSSKPECLDEVKARASELVKTVITSALEVLDKKQLSSVQVDVVKRDYLDFVSKQEVIDYLKQFTSSGDQLDKFFMNIFSRAKPTTIKDALKRWEEKHKTNAAEATEVIISFQWPPIEKMDSSLGVLTKCE
uniref:Uncharacterized protein n=1 Tax=Timema bartmani TaxID=61472 RepID=A0A7R9EWN6_9NEOP|nr:unnamed protein product [Timema bartmani]